MGAVEPTARYTSVRSECVAANERSRELHKHVTTYCSEGLVGGVLFVYNGREGREPGVRQLAGGLRGLAGACGGLAGIATSGTVALKQVECKGARLMATLNTLYN